MQKVIFKWKIHPETVCQIYSTAWEVDGRYVLKVYDDRNALERNVQLLEALKEEGIPVAGIVRLPDGAAYLHENGRYYILMHKLPGDNTEYGKWTPEMAYKMGEVIAGLHVAFRKCEAKLTFWDNSLLDEIQGWIRTELEKRGWPLVSQAEFEQTVSALKLNYDELPRQLIHRDVHLGNFLFHDGDFSGYIDFDLSQKNIRIFDLCYFLLSLLLEKSECPIDEERWLDTAAHVVSGYESRIRLNEAEKRALPCVMESIELLFVAYFIQANETDHAREAAKLFQFVCEKERDIVGVLGGKA